MYRQRGFTLVELLVVIAIIGTLIALLLPAVNAAREQGRSTVCKNNLHQLATACMEHTNLIGSFPSGGWGSNWVGIPDLGYGPNQPGGWIYQILPYMDQNALHDLGKGNASTQAASSAKRISTAIPILNCPTRRAGVTYPVGSGSSGANPGSPLLTSPVQQANRTDYAINGGSFYIQHGPGPSSSSAAASNSWPSLTNFNGIASVHSQITFANVPDNKDTMYLIGEKYMSPENYITGNDPGDQFSAMSGDDVSLIRWSCMNCQTGTSAGTMFLPQMDRVATNNPPPQGYYGFGSSHGAGWHAAFVGGNVQLVGWGIDPVTHAAASTRNGHEVIDPTKIHP
jgi:prepilin-type N-terminal cleavage/methylation domain-containing protein